MIYILVILILVFGISKALCDISESGFYNSKLKNLDPQYWDKHKSWRNKWKGGVAANGEEYFGSSTFLVWTTDAWHLFNILSYLSMFMIGILAVSLSKNLLFLTVVFLLCFTTFELIYRYIKK